ncbi:hypothetical protein ABIA35_002506 [Catenulispora sp. MAP12-49]
MDERKKAVGETRFVGSVFLARWPYWLINLLRSSTLDLAVFVPVLFAGLWWVNSSGGLRMPLNADWSADDTEFSVLSHHVAQYYPTFLALVYCAILVWHNRTQSRVRWYSGLPPIGLEGSSEPGIPRRVRATADGINHLIAFGFMLLAVFDLLFIPGSAVQRFLPLAATAAWAWLVRNQIRGRLRLLTATEAGYRPPVRTAFRRRTKSTLLLLYSQVLVDVTTDGYELAARQTADPRFQAWLLAKAVDWRVARGAFGKAEALLAPERTDRLPEAAEMPAFLAANGVFQLAVGRVDEAGHAFQAAYRSPRGRRTPRALGVLADSAGVALSGHRLRARPVRDIWQRRYSVVLNGLIERIREGRARDPRRASTDLRRVVGLADMLGRRWALAALNGTEAARLESVKASAHTQAAEILADEGDGAGAAAEFFAAARAYRRYGDRVAAGLARARRAEATLSVPGIGGAAEKEALDELRSGLQQVEDNRGDLRSALSRTTTVAAYERVVYGPVLTLLAHGLTHHPEAGAELALWLMESTRRNALADALQAARAEAESRREFGSAAELANSAEADSQTVADSADPRVRGYVRTTSEAAELEARRQALDLSQRQRFELAYRPRPVDLADVYRRLGNRVALSFRCTAVDDGWLITTVLISPLGPRLGQRHVRRPAEAGPWYKHPALFLDWTDREQRGQLDVGGVPVPYQTRMSGRDIWRRVAETLLPEELAETLYRTAAGSSQTPVLVIVPDGPLCAVPFAGLRMPDGRTLIEHAVVVFVPNLDMIEPEPGREPEPRRRPGSRGASAATSGPAVVVANLGRTELRLDEPGVVVRTSSDRKAFLDGLRQLPSPAAAVISNHGWLGAKRYEQIVVLNDETPISVALARELPWPPVVVLGTCWAGRLTITPGDDAIGFPVACLLGGANTVVGSQAPIDNEPESQAIVAAAVRAAAHDEHPAASVTRALADLAARRRNSLPPPSHWASLTVWTTLLPTAPPGLVLPPSVTVTWNPQGTVHHGGAADARLDDQVPLRLPVSVALRRVLLHAHTQSAGGAVGTQAVLASATVADDIDLASYLIAIGVGAPSLGHRPNREAGSEVQLRLDEDGSVCLTAAVSQALLLGERLANAMNDPVLAPAHVVYGIVNDEQCDATQWIRSHPLASTDLVAPLSDRVFGQDLPAAADLPADTTSVAAATGDPAGGVLTIPAARQGRYGELLRSRSSAAVAVRSAVVRRARRTVRTLLISAVVAGFLGAFMLTVSLYRIGNASSTTNRLAAVSARLSATVTAAGASAQPALFLGSLHQYYVRPAIAGDVNLLKAGLDSSTPGSLSSLFVFASPRAAGDTSQQEPVVLHLHTGDYSAVRFCADGLQPVLCFVVAHLPASAVPAGNLWHVIAVPDEPTGKWAAKTVVLGTAGPAGPVTAAHFEITSQNGTETCAVRRDDGQPVPLLSPVVLTGGDYNIPIEGVASQREPDGSSDVVPVNNIAPYLELIAGWQGGTAAGAVGRIGVTLGADGMATAAGRGIAVDSVELGGSADFAGLQAHDIIVGVNGKPVSSGAALTALIRGLTPGTTMSLRVVRRNTTMTYQLKVGYIYA